MDLDILPPEPPSVHEEKKKRVSVKKNRSAKQSIDSKEIEKLASYIPSSVKKKEKVLRTKEEELERQAELLKKREHDLTLRLERFKERESTIRHDYELTIHALKQQMTQLQKKHAIELATKKKEWEQVLHAQIRQAHDKQIDVKYKELDLLLAKAKEEKDHWISKKEKVDQLLQKLAIKQKKLEETYREKLDKAKKKLEAKLSEKSKQDEWQEKSKKAEQLVATLKERKRKFEQELVDLKKEHSRKLEEERKKLRSEIVRRGVDTHRSLSTNLQKKQKRLEVLEVKREKEKKEWEAKKEKLEELLKKLAVRDAALKKNEVQLQREKRRLVAFEKQLFRKANRKEKLSVSSEQKVSALASGLKEFQSKHAEQEKLLSKKEKELNKLKKQLAQKDEVEKKHQHREKNTQTQEKNHEKLIVLANKRLIALDKLEKDLTKKKASMSDRETVLLKSEKHLRELAVTLENLKKSLYQKERALLERFKELDQKEIEAEHMTGEALALQEKIDKEAKAKQRKYNQELAEKLESIAQIESALKKELKELEEKTAEVEQNRFYKVDLAAIEKEIREKQVLLKKLRQSVAIHQNAFNEKKQELERWEGRLQKKEEELDRQINLVLDIRSGAPKHQKKKPTQDSTTKAHLLELAGYCRTLIDDERFTEARSLHADLKRKFMNAKLSKTDRRELSLVINDLYSDVHLARLRH